MGRVLRDSWLVAVFVFLTGVVASAQLSTAQLSGRVTDESGARAAGRHRDGHADGDGLHPHRRDRQDGATCCRTCRPAPIGWR